MKKLFSIRAIILAGSLLLQLNTLCFQSHGAAGDVDLSFDPGSGVNGTVNAVVVQPDGKAILGGEFTTVRGLARSRIARLNADGTGDSGFDASEAAPYGVTSVALQPDGKVLVGYYLGILRLNSNGSVDNTFSVSMPSFFEDEGVRSIAVQSDGKVLIGGRFTLVNGTNRTGIARLNANGSLDSSFNPGTQQGFANALALQPDGKVLVAGYFTTNSTNHIGMVRFNANGTLDHTFNLDQPFLNALDVLALQQDGKVLVAGYFPNGRYQLARLNANGSLDGSFNPGPLITNASYPRVDSIRVQPDAKVLISGNFRLGAADGEAVVRLFPNGNLDNSFNCGVLNSTVLAMGLQADGNVLIGGGFTKVDSAIRKRMARLNTNGSLDSSFDPGSEISGDLSSQVSSVIAQPDGKVLIGGWFNSVQGTNRNRIARLNADGTLDTTFDPGTGTGLYSVVRSLALQPDGKVLIAGNFTTFNGTNRDGIALLNANGTLDSGFAPNLTTLNQYDDCPPGYSCYKYTEANAVVAQSNGKVLVGGDCWTIVYGQQEGEDTLYFSRCFLARFNADGSLDSGFAPVIGTYATTDVRALTVQPDGKIIVIGNFLNGTNWSVINRINANGTLDNSFNAGTGINGVSSVASQPDGKVLIAGIFSSINGINRDQIARLNTNGSLDGSFDPNAGILPIAGGSISAIALQADGKVLIGGAFYIVNGGGLPKGLARLNANGSLDTSFNPGTAPVGGVVSITLQADGNVLVGGDFTLFNGAMRNSMARLYGDSVAPSLNITRSNVFVIISWPVTGLTFQLQETTDLSLPNSWSPVAQTTVTNAGQISATIPTSAGRKLFRLKSQ